ncbi:MAG: 4-hydroxy-tetrahydrodipicolinate reductase [Halanaerobiaceae bacterium]
MTKKIFVNGACGRMGNEVIKTVVNDTEHRLVGGYDIENSGRDIVKLLGLDGPPAPIYENLNEGLNVTDPDIIVDFTSPEVVMENITTGLQHSIHMVVGTTGITEADMEKIKNLTAENEVNALIVPNFALGAVLLMQFASKAANYFPDVEIIELHHDQKIDAPSGTSIKTAELINDNRKQKKENKIEELEKIRGARGGEKNGIHIHSVRLPGLVAHQEVIFGSEGQTLTLRHDSYDRKSFMPGVRMAIDKVENINGLVYGLENII